MSAWAVGEYGVPWTFDLRVPFSFDHVGICGTEHRPGGMVCTRRFGHTGRHAAHGERRDDNRCPVYAVWEQS